MHVEVRHLYRPLRLDDIRHDGAQVGLRGDVVVLGTEFGLVHHPGVIDRLLHDFLALAQHVQRLLQKQHVVVCLPHLIDHVHP